MGGVGGARLSCLWKVRMEALELRGWLRVSGNVGLGCRKEFKGSDVLDVTWSEKRGYARN